MGKTGKKKHQAQEVAAQQQHKRNDRLEKKRIKKSKHSHVAKDYQSNEEKKFANDLLQEGYLIEIIEADGNCLFRSISDQLHQHQNHHSEIRQQILHFIEENAEHFQLFIEDDESFVDYLSRMRENGEWGGHQELYAASQVLNVNIHVHQLDAPQFLLPASGSGKNPTIRDIHLSYHGEYHYNSLKPISGILPFKFPLPYLTIPRPTRQGKRSQEMISMA
jgi:OTU domain-containing protein 3